MSRNCQAFALAGLVPSPRVAYDPAVVPPLLPLLLSAAFAADEFGDFTYYYGDFHVHTGVSGDGGSSDLTCDGDCGAWADVYTSGRDNGLDFMAVSDHVNGTTAAASASGMADNFTLAASELDEAGGFVTIPAAEIWAQVAGAHLGHRTLLMFEDDASLAAITLTDLQPVGTTDVDVGSCSALETWATNLAATWGSMLLIPHHPAVTMPMWTDWSCYQLSFEPVVEIYSEHGNSLGDGLGYDDVWSGEHAGSTVLEAIDPDGLALEMGFVAASDKHNSRAGDVCSLDTEMKSHPYGGGLTVVAIPTADTFDRMAIYDAMVEHRTLATTGPALPVELRFESGGASLATLGESVGLPTGQELDVLVAVPESLAAYVIEVVAVTPASRFTMDDLGGGEWSTTLDTADASGWVYVSVEIDGDLWYGSAGCDDGGSDTLEYVWTSPGYISDAAGDLDGDGMTVADGDCDDGDNGISLGADEVAGDSIDQDCDGADEAIVVEGIFDTGTVAIEPDTATVATIEAASPADPDTGTAPVPRKRLGSKVRRIAAGIPPAVRWRPRR